MNILRYNNIILNYFSILSFILACSREHSTTNMNNRLNKISSSSNINSKINNSNFIKKHKNDGQINNIDQFRKCSVVLLKFFKDICEISERDTLKKFLIEFKKLWIEEGYDYQIIQAILLNNDNPNSDAISDLLGSKGSINKEIIHQGMLSLINKNILCEKRIFYPTNYKKIKIFSSGKKWDDDIKPKYNSLKEEMIKNEFAPISENRWNLSLKICNKILKGPFKSEKNIEFADQLKINGIEMKHLVALELFINNKKLKLEFKKSFWSPFNKNIIRLQSFYYLKILIDELFNKLSNIPELEQPKNLFYGINKMPIEIFNGKYDGPLSANTSLDIASSFAGYDGMILVIKPNYKQDFLIYGYIKNNYDHFIPNDLYKLILSYYNYLTVLDLSWIAKLPQEKEYLLWNSNIEIIAAITKKEFFKHNSYYQKVLINGENKNSLNNTLYQKQKKIPLYLEKIKYLTKEIEIKEIKTINGIQDIKPIYDFDKQKLLYQDKIKLFIWLFEIAKEYQNNKTFEADYQFLNSNIQYRLRKIYDIKISLNLFNHFLNKLDNNINSNQILKILQKYFKFLGKKFSIKK